MTKNQEIRGPFCDLAVRPLHSKISGEFYFYLHKENPFIDRTATAILVLLQPTAQEPSLAMIPYSSLHTQKTDLLHVVFPGGKIEEAEPPENAALRETGEEMPISIRRDLILLPWEALTETRDSLGFFLEEQNTFSAQDFLEHISKTLAHIPNIEQLVAGLSRLDPQALFSFYEGLKQPLIETLLPESRLQDSVPQPIHRIFINQSLITRRGTPIGVDDAFLYPVLGLSDIKDGVLKIPIPYLPDEETGSTNFVSLLKKGIEYVSQLRIFPKLKYKPDVIGLALTIALILLAYKQKATIFELLKSKGTIKQITIFPSAPSEPIITYVVYNSYKLNKLPDKQLYAFIKVEQYSDGNVSITEPDNQSPHDLMLFLQDIITQLRETIPPATISDILLEVLGSDFIKEILQKFFRWIFQQNHENAQHLNEDQATYLELLISAYTLQTQRISPKQVEQEFQQIDFLSRRVGQFTVHVSQHHTQFPGTYTIPEKMYIQDRQGNFYEGPLLLIN